MDNVVVLPHVAQRHGADARRDGGADAAQPRQLPEVGSAGHTGADAGGALSPIPRDARAPLVVLAGIGDLDNQTGVCLGAGGALNLLDHLLTLIHRRREELLQPIDG